MISSQCSQLNKNVHIFGDNCYEVKSLWLLNRRINDKWVCIPLDLINIQEIDEILLVVLVLQKLLFQQSEPNFCLKLYVSNSVLSSAADALTILGQPCMGHLLKTICSRKPLTKITFNVLRAYSRQPFSTLLPLQSWINEYNRTNAKVINIILLIMKCSTKKVW